MKQIHKTHFGEMNCADSLDALRGREDNSVDLIFTSPPYDMNRKKKYGNRKGEEYQAWISEFGAEFYRVLKPSGSLVMDLGSGWTEGSPTKNLYEYRILLNFVDNLGFHLAQDFFWWDPTRLPTPAQWVNVERVRVKDAVNKIWWFSKTENPKADNRRIRQEYSKATKVMLATGTNVGKRASGHEVSDKFHVNNGGSIPPNLLAISNSISQESYSIYCSEKLLTLHPARIHPLIPEFFVRMLTEAGDLVIDPFAGSCVTGAVCERLERNWICYDLVEEYLLGGVGRFEDLFGDGKKLARIRDYRVTAPNFVDDRQMTMFGSNNPEQLEIFDFETNQGKV